MKKRLVIFLVLILGLTSLPVLATVNHSTDIDLYIDPEGNGHFTTTYEYTDDQGTEHYIPIDLTEPKDLSNYEVFYNDQLMVYEPNWDIHASFEEKAGKYGLLETPTGYEMTYGITNYGENTFRLEYTIDNLITQTNDYNMLYHQFLSPDLSENPGRVRLTISADQPFKDEDIRFWSFGMDSVNELVDGKILFESTDNFRFQYLIGLVRFPLEMFNAVDHVDQDFEYYRAMAFEGSEYDIDASTEYYDDGYDSYYQEPSLWDIIMPLIMPLLFILFLLFGVVANRDKGLQIPKNIRPKGFYHRDPQGMTIDKFYYPLSRAGETTEENYITAYFLKWIYEGRVEMVEIDGGMFSFKPQSAMKLVDKTSPVESKAEQQLLTMVIKAAKDDLLEDKEMTRYVSRYPKELQDFYSTLRSDSYKYMRDEDYIGVEIQKKFLSKRKIETLTDKGTQLLKELLGFKAFLSDYSLLRERESINVHLWDYYMIYAGLFGITEKVQKEFAKLYPQYIQQTRITPSTIYMTNAMSHNMYRSYSSAINPPSSARSSGGFGGGGSFGGGGGGFSGGGSGGGTR